MESRGIIYNHGKAIGDGRMMRNMRWSLTILSLIWVSASSAHDMYMPKPFGTNACILKTTCHECIQTPHCAWCLKPDFEFDRCFLPHVNLRISEDCANHTFNPSNEFIKIRHKEIWKGSYSIQGGREEGFDYTAGGHHSSKTNYITDTSSGSKVQASSRREAVQLYPQEISLKLRMNEKQKVSIQYAQAEDYPVDLYYLMDLSNSMKDDKQKLSDLGELLVQSMSNITSNFRLGFGSFVDKVVMPYVSIVPKALQEPCDGCAAPYGYRNHMQLNTDTSDFTKLVRNTSVSGNLDAPEGGFDAIMQAIVCRDEVGWRDNARKLLLFSTDAGFHFAGDGKLSGIVKPNDGCCHLNSAGEYDMSVVQDYPSIAQINTKVKENSVNIIWAVTEEQLSIYESLTKHVEGSYAAKLSEDSSNIVELVREQYNAISSTIEMKDTSSSYVSIKYFSTCLGGPRLQTKKCEGLKVGDKVEFEAEILLNACPQDRSEWVQNFTIQPIGISESLTINLEMICDCQCENPNDESFVPNSPMCNYHGDLKCGNCICHENYFGKRCECGTNDITQAKYNPYACRDGNSTIDCSGRGICECNQCTCNKRDDESEVISGRYCECDNFNCDRGNGLLCSGNGICGCYGRCICNEGWMGNNCGCSTDESTCYNRNTGKICSDHGTCECGKCNCKAEGEHIYTGEVCNVCLTCSTECEKLKPCVLCKVYQEYPQNFTEEDCRRCPDFEWEIVETLEIDVEKDEIGCYGIDTTDCKFFFAYYLNVTTNRFQVMVQKARECPPEVYLLGIILGVIAAVVFIGMAFLVVWKMYATYADRREFARFEKERMMARWDASENPIYRQATSTFKNPTYMASAAASASSQGYSHHGGGFQGGRH